MVPFYRAAVSMWEQLVRVDSDARVRQRAQCLLVVAKTCTQQAATGLTGIDPKTLAPWRTRFEADGRTGLVDRPRPGRPAKLSEEARTVLATVLDELPTEPGYATATWTLADLQVLLQRHGWTVAGTTVARTLHYMGYGYTRPKHDLGHRQDADHVATAA